MIIGGDLNLDEAFILGVHYLRSCFPCKPVRIQPPAAPEQKPQPARDLVKRFLVVLCLMVVVKPCVKMALLAPGVAKRHVP